MCRDHRAVEWLVWPIPPLVGRNRKPACAHESSSVRSVHRCRCAGDGLGP